MFSLIIIAAFLIIFGRRLRYKYLYTDNKVATLYQSYKRIKNMDQDSACYVIGGFSLEFAGIIVLFSILTSLF